MMNQAVIAVTYRKFVLHNQQHINSDRRTRVVSSSISCNLQRPSLLNSQTSSMEKRERAWYLFSLE